MSRTSIMINNRIVPVMGQYVDMVIQSKLFNGWVSKLDPRFDIRQMTFQSVDIVGDTPNKRPIFIKLRVKLNMEALGLGIVNRVAFIRGGSVAILCVLECEGEEYTILTVQPRFPAGTWDVPDIPAGMLDNCGNFAGVAARELEEEAGVTIPSHKLVNMTQLVYGPIYGDGQGVYPSAGGCDEQIHYFYYHEVVTRSRLEELQGKLTGCPGEGEYIVLKIVPLEDLILVPDGKALAAQALYSRLASRGILKPKVA